MPKWDAFWKSAWTKPAAVATRQSRRRGESGLEALESRIALATLIWDGSAGDGNWFNGQNWNLNAVPGTGDTAILDTNSTINLTANADVGSFQQRAGTLTGSGVLTVFNTLIWAGGTMSGTGATNANGSLLMDGTTVFLNGRTLSIPQGQTATLSGASSALGLQNGAIFNNGGTFFAQSDTATDIFFNGGTGNVFNNTGIFTRNQTTGDFSIGVPFVNSGTVNVLSGTLSLTGGDGVGMTNGDFNIASGAILDFRGAFELATASDISGAGTVDFSGNVVTLGGNFVIPTLLISGGTAVFDGSASVTTMDLSSGTLSGAGTVSASGVIRWTAGFMSGTGVTNANGGVLINGATAFLNGRTFNLPAGQTATLGGANSGLGLQNGAIFNNAGTFLAQNDTGSDLFFNGGTGNLFNNIGVFTRELTTGDFTVAVEFANSGTVNLTSGTLSFTGGDGANPTTGDFNVSAGAVLDFRSSFDLGTTANVRGAGTIDFSGATVTVAGGFAIPATLISGGTVDFASSASTTTLDFSRGTLMGAGTLTVGGLITWSGGTMSGTGVTNANGGLLMDGSAVFLNGRSLNLPVGQSAILGGTNSSLGFANGAVFNNAGTFFAQSDAASDLFFNGGTGGLFNNAGVFTRDTTAGDFDVSVAFSNSGVVNIVTGTLSLSAGGGTNPATGDFNVASGATLRFEADFNLGTGDVSGAGTVEFFRGTVPVNGTFAIPVVAVTGGIANFNVPTATLQNLTVSLGTANFNTTDSITLASLTVTGGTLTGKNTIASSGLLTWSGGTMSGSGVTNADGGLLINGNVVVLDGRIFNLPPGQTAELSGINSSLALQNGGQFNNGGTFLAQNDTGNDIFFNGGAPPLFNNTGTFTREINTGDFVVTAPFANSGVVNANAGTLTFTATDGPGATTGDFNVALGASLEFNSAFELASGSDVFGNGVVEFSRGIVTIDGSFAVPTVLITGGTVDFNIATSGLKTLNISGGSATFNTNDTITLSALTIANGTLAGTNTIVSSGLITWSGGTMSGTGATNADGGLIMNGSAVFLNGRTLNLPAGQTATLSGSNGLGMQNGARINNAGMFLVQNDVLNDLFNLGGAPSLFHNTGTFVFDLPAPGKLDVFIPFANGGTLDLRSSSAVFNNGFTQAGGGAILAGNTVTFASGPVLAAGTIAADVSNTGATLSPGEAGVGDLSITGDYAQSAAGTLRIDFGGGVAGDAFDQLIVSGVATLSGTLNLSLAGGFMPPNTPFNVLTYGSRSGSFGNVTGAAGVTPDYQPTGLVLTRISTTTNYVWDGGGGPDTNWFTAANWGPDGVPGPGDTATLNSNFTITLPSVATVSSFTQSDGTFTGPGRLNVKDFMWSGGTQSGTGITATLPGGTLSIEGSATKIVTERMLNATGSATWTGTGNVQMSAGARFINSGNFAVQNDARLEFVGVGPDPLFRNNGTFRKTVTGGNTTLAGIDFENLGQVALASGTLVFEGASASFTQTRGMTLLAGGSLSATNVVVTFDGGVLAGSGSIGASVINTGAVVHPGGRGNPGTLGITGDYTQSGAARVVIELGGKTAGVQHDRVVIGGIATLGGALEVNSIRGFALRDRSSFGVISYGSFNGGPPLLDAPAGISVNTGASMLILNARAPAPGPRTMTLLDRDGDTVTATVTKGSIPLGAITTGPNGEFQKFDLRAVESKLNGAKLTIDVTQNGGGDGLADVGVIEAAGMDLRKITVAGDLGRINIGSGSAGKAALKSLVVGSLGVLGSANQPVGTDDPLLSEVTGSLNKLTVERDVQNAVIELSGKLGKVVIGGNLVDNRSTIPLAARAGSIGVFLNGGIPPAESSNAGSIFAPNVGSVTVMGDVDGGEIGAETTIKKVKILGRLTSEDPLDPAILRVGTAVDKIVVEGDVKNALILSGYNKSFEPVDPDATIGKLKVKGNWTGSSVVAGIADTDDDGFGVGDILIAGDTTANRISKIASVIIEGIAVGSPTLTDNSAISAQKISALRIAGADVPLTSGIDALVLDPLNQNFRAVEI